MVSALVREAMVPRRKGRGGANGTGRRIAELKIAFYRYQANTESKNRGKKSTFVNFSQPRRASTPSETFSGCCVKSRFSP